MLAKQLISETCEKQRINPGQLIIHSDRGAPMKSQTVALALCIFEHYPKFLSTLPLVMIILFLEAQFKTSKYHPSYPGLFGVMQDAVQWARPMMHWYNNEHYNSGLNYFTAA